MDHFESAAKSLHRDQDSKRLLQKLAAVREGLDGNHEDRISFLINVGAVKNLISCLQQDKTSILDVTLSIIGNCCTDISFSRELIKYSIFHILYRVLERCQKDSVQGRIFRIIGNLSDDHNNHILREPSLLKKIINILSKASEDVTEVSDATIHMSIRAFRKLATQTLLPFLIENNVMKVIGSLLIKFTAGWKSNTSDKLLAQDTLRLLHVYSRFSNFNIISDLKNTPRGNALQCLSDILDLYPLRVVKIIMNLSRSVTLKSDLPVKEVCRDLIKGTDKYRLSKVYLIALHKLLEDPANWEYLFEDDNLNDLINAFNNVNKSDDYNYERSSLLLSIIYKTQHSRLNHMQSYIKAGAIPALTRKLEWINHSSTDIVIPEHVKRKRVKTYSNYNKRMKLFKSLSSYTLIDDAARDRNRCNSPSQLSDISSDGPNSPKCSMNQEICTSDSENYSPICSDAEDVEVYSVRSLNQNAMDEYHSSSSEEENVSSCKKSFFMEIIVLLSKYIKLQPLSKDLLDLKLLILLMNVCLVESETSAHCCLAGILTSTDHIVTLMKSTFVDKLYKILNTTHDVNCCAVCGYLYKTASEKIKLLEISAETDMGRGTIAHDLLRSNGETQKLIASRIPLVIKTKSTLSKLMINCKGLNIMMSTLNKRDLNADTVKGLHVLADHRLKIKNPISNLKEKKVNVINPDKYSAPDKCDNIVKFKFDDSDLTVSADRDFLCGQGDYFNGLLNGNFKESNEEEIELKEIACATFKCLLMLLNRDRSADYVHIKLETMLDLLKVTDLYILPELQVYLTECVEKVHLNQRTAPNIYKWAIESGTNLMRVECVVFMLVQKMHDKERFDIFKELVEFDFQDYLVDDIKALLLRYL